MESAASLDKSFAVMEVAKGISLAYLIERRPVADKASRILNETLFFSDSGLSLPFNVELSS